MEIWKKNLYVCWFAVFIVSLGMSQMAPALPLYIEHLGIHGAAAIAKWSGIVFGSNFISLAIFAPIWGKYADKYGRKSMILRASLWLSIIVTCMGFVDNVYQLTGLRIFQGALSGFQSAAITLIATQTPNEQVGWAMGILFSGQVGGTLLGPLFGGYLAEIIGFRATFISIGCMCFIAFIASFLFIQESEIIAKKQCNLNFHEVWELLPSHKVTVCLFITTLVMQLALMSIQPIITVYIAQLSSGTNHIALISGAVFAASGLASIISAPRLGKISDRIGPQKVLLAALLVAGALFIPQAFVEHPWELGALRFLLGLATAGLLPSVNSLIAQSTPQIITGRALGYNQSAQFFGVFIGSVLGGQMAGAFGIRYVFFFTGGLLLVNGLWVYHTIYKEKFNTC
ncbi:MFS transporter [Pelosinus propionicus]|uniref:Predicted arabinose efflux permease, MFS family n=1 Tax=Pelosinus propionicus DSM 13327 TaxID=1123291 RepID=A0A1I4HPD8_9FIRM|nr:MFS transporter [Pelosinus propionicus]SFL43613.1 Predicted arabinose efflux permease, MFS family [Pelosinus propionicus DSM 13327]